MNIICKYYKKNKYNKLVFIVNDEIDKSTYNLMTSLNDKINDNYSHNPIFKQTSRPNNPYFITFNNNINDLEQYGVYNFTFEVRSYKDKYINFHVLGKLNKQKNPTYKVLNLNLKKIIV